MSPEHVVIEGSHRKALPGAKAIGRVNPNIEVEVTIKLRRKTPLPALDGRPVAPLSRAEIARKYGASQEDMDKVLATFEAFGLTTVASNAATRSVRVSGPAATMERAFLVQLFNYTHPTGDYRGRVGHVHVPRQVKDIVQGVFGLDNRRVANRKKSYASAQARHAGVIPASWYTSAQLAARYQFPPGDGSGQAVGLLEFGGGYFESDLQRFCTLADIPMPDVVTVSTDGTSTSARDGAEGEVMLDVEVIAGVCPASTIVVYFAEFTEQGWITAIDAAVQDSDNDPGVLSVSWGYTEDEDIWTPAAMTAVNEALQEAALAGMTVCVASGDDGSSDAIMDGRAHVGFPASSPYVCCVGGTTAKKGSALPDVTWKEGDGLRSDQHGSSGGGVSAMFPRPTWQSAVTIQSANHGALLGRCLPDLSANADWDAAPYALLVDGQLQPNGGTSAAAPLVATLFTRINAGRSRDKRVGYVTPVLYQPVAGGNQPVGLLGCSDVVRGNNITAAVGGYSAAAGYDAATGWGTPIGIKLQELL